MKVEVGQRYRLKNDGMECVVIKVLKETCTAPLKSCKACGKHQALVLIDNPGSRTYLWENLSIQKACIDCNPNLERIEDDDNSKSHDSL